MSSWTILTGNCTNGLNWPISVISMNHTKLILTKIKQITKFFDNRLEWFTQKNRMSVRKKLSADEKKTIHEIILIEDSPNQNDLWWEPTRTSNRKLKEQLNENGFWKSAFIHAYDTHICCCFCVSVCTLKRAHVSARVCICAQSSTLIFLLLSFMELNY